MRRSTTTATALIALTLLACGGERADTQGSEQAEATASADVTAEQVRRAVARQIESGGDSVTLTDPTRGEEVRLAFDRVHEHVMTTEGGRRYVCVDFRGPEGTVYDVDYYLDARDGEPVVEDRILHMVGERSVVADSVRRRLNAES